jgi:PBP1b-binding outer membrane lipoprotein LpoB
VELKPQILLVAALTVLVGCTKTDQTQSETNPDQPVTAKQVQDRYKDAAVATKDYVAENKDEFVASMDMKFKQLDVKIDELAKKSEGYKDDAKVQADKALAELSEQRDKAKVKFEETKKASAAAWKDVEAGFASEMSKRALPQSWMNWKRPTRTPSQNSTKPDISHHCARHRRRLGRRVRPALGWSSSHIS